MTSTPKSLWAEPAEDPLAGLRVVDFGQYIAGPLVAMMLADQGADVIRVDPPGGPTWVRDSNAALLRGRRNIQLDLKSETGRSRARALIADSDVVVENFRPGVMARLGLGYDDLALLAPRLIYCSLPGFGVADPRANIAGWEGVVMAAAGAYFPSPANWHDHDTATPRFSPVALASVFAGIEGAMAIAAALIARERDRVGQWIEVPLYNAVFEGMGSRATFYAKGAGTFTSFGSGVYRCADGRNVTFVANWFRHLTWFLECAGQTSRIDEGFADITELRASTEKTAELRRRLTEVFLTRDAEEWERIARQNGCSIAMWRTPAEWLGENASTLSESIASVADPQLGLVKVPGKAVQRETAPRTVAAREPSGEADKQLFESFDQREAPGAAEFRRAESGPLRPPLDGINVIDLSRVVAAPTTAKLLGQLGAYVVKIDADPAQSEASFEEPLMHEHLNRAKSTLILDLRQQPDQQLFHRMLARSDVLVQNFTARAMQHIGSDENTIRRLSPKIVHLYLNAFGTRGPWADFRGYAELANVATGLTTHVLGDSRIPTGSDPVVDYPRFFFTDYATGVLGAFGALVGLYFRQRSGEGSFMETSLARATALEQFGWIVEASQPRGANPVSDHGWSSNQRLFHVKDGWIFLGIAADRFEGLVSTLGAEPTDGRRDPLMALEEALSLLTTVEAERRLIQAGAGVHRVQTVSEVMAPGGLADELGLRAEDPSERFGTVVMPGPVAHFSRTPMLTGDLPRRPFGADRENALQQFGVA